MVKHTYESIPKEFRERWLAGDTIDELAEKFLVTRPVVRYWVFKLGLPKRPMGRNSKSFVVAYMQRQIRAKS